MNIRYAITADIPQIQLIRNAVTENKLSDPGIITDSDCDIYINQRGKGWVCEFDNTIVGFAIADLKENNIWALFVHPEYERNGIGRKLHDTMINWYFSKTSTTVWLSTDPGTRAEQFYRKAGWKESGIHKSEIKFEMEAQTWHLLSINSK